MLVIAIVLVLGGAVVLAVWPISANRPVLAPAATRPNYATTSAADAGAIAVSERVVLALCDLSVSRARPDLSGVAGVLTSRGRRQLSADAGGLTAAEVSAGVGESAAIAATSVAGEGTGRVAVWVDALVTLTAPGRSPQRVAAPLVVEVVHAGRGWLVDGVGEP